MMTADEIVREIFETNLKDKLFGLVRKIAGHNNAEDAFQDGLIQVVQKSHTFKGNSSLGTWLYRVFSNAALMVLRKEKQHEAKTNRLKEYINLTSIPHDHQSPYAQYKQAEIIVISQKAIDKYFSSSRYFTKRDAMKIIGGEMISEVAKKKGLKVNAAKSCYFRMKQEIKADLVDYLEKAA
jgi:RNA polymerase sigma factor (sigma-70 family)